MWDLIVSVPDHCLSFYFLSIVASAPLIVVEPSCIFISF